MEDALLKLRLLEKEGNFNAVVAAAVEHYEDFALIRPELLTRMGYYLENFKSLLSPRTINAIRALPASDLSWSGLSDLLEAGSVGEKQKPSIGKMVFPVVTSVGLAREILVEGGDNRALSPARLQVMDRAGSAVFKAVRQQTGRHCNWRPDRFSFSVLDPYSRDDPAVEGDSMSLALAIALYSRLTAMPVPGDFSATAALGRDGRVHPVRNLEEKLKALKRERFFINRVLVSASQETRDVPPGIEIIRVGSLEEALSIVFPHALDAAHFKGDIDLHAELHSLNGQYKSYLIDTCLENAEELITYLQSRPPNVPFDRLVPALFTCYWKKGSCHCHKGQVKDTERSLKKALRLYRKHPGVIRTDEYFLARVQYAVLLKDIFRYGDAEAMHMDLMDEMKKGGSLDHLKGQNLSSLSQLYLAMGRFKEAEKYQRLALPLIREEERCRNYGYLAQIQARNGDYRMAASALSKYKRLLGGLHANGRAAHTPFYHWMKAEYLFRRGTALPKKRSRVFRELHGIAERYPEPDWWVPSLIRKFSGLALLVQGKEAEGLQELDRIVWYFSRQFAPVLRVLGVSVRAERARYFFETGRCEKAREDVHGIVEDLSLQKDIKRFFRPELLILSRFLKSAHQGTKGVGKVYSAVSEIIAKIPY